MQRLSSGQFHRRARRNKDDNADVADGPMREHNTSMFPPRDMKLWAPAILLTCMGAKQHQARPSFAELSASHDKRNTTETRTPLESQRRQSEDAWHIMES
jgi:hypothetical protein